MKIVLDTNCLLAAILPKSPCYWLWESFCEGRFTLCFSTDMIQEYAELLSCFYSPGISESTMQVIINSPGSEQVIPYCRWNLIAADPTTTSLWTVRLMPAPTAS